ncbi:sulfonate ABC transporter substrate-binding protein [Aneurinibacillus tyrosinisolvens]|uniref:sulfonate ABC transporter substrate-binding protein n=1 Tax=Aneurinibacillus tyrosinisolvens TaxID=1443435 RepID=UPI00063FCCDD
MKHRKIRSRLILFLMITALAALTMLAGCSPGAKEGKAADSPEQHTIRIGYQKFGTLNILKAQGTLEKQAKLLGISVEWIQFPAGPQLLEAMHVGSIDIGHTGEAPPIFAQAADTPLVYVGNEPPNPAGEAILVPKNSPIRTLADLKGKKVALNKGSNVHYLLVKALESAGLKYTDIQPVYLPPADGRSAFERGSVDAWVIWDPFYTAAQRATQARVLVDGKGLVANREFILASRSFAKDQSKALALVLDELKKTDNWVKQNPQKVAEFLSPQIGIDVDSLKEVLARRTFDVQSIDSNVLKEQQKIADTFYQVKLIPKQLTVKDAVVNN